MTTTKRIVAATIALLTLFPVEADGFPYRTRHKRRGCRRRTRSCGASRPRAYSRNS